jgi:hypothetical protein
MENSAEAKIYSLDEVVLFRGEVYIVAEVHMLNWFSKDPFVYGLINYKQRKQKEVPDVYVRSEFIKKASEEDLVMVLYGK